MLGQRPGWLSRRPPAALHRIKCSRRRIGSAVRRSCRLDAGIRVFTDVPLPPGALTMRSSGQMRADEGVHPIATSPPASLAALACPVGLRKDRWLTCGDGDGADAASYTSQPCRGGRWQGVARTEGEATCLYRPKGNAARPI